MIRSVVDLPPFVTVIVVGIRIGEYLPQTHFLIVIGMKILVNGTRWLLRLKWLFVNGRKEGTVPSSLVLFGLFILSFFLFSLVFIF